MTEVARVSHWRAVAAAITGAIAVVGFTGLALAAPTQLPRPEAHFLDVPTVDLDPAQTTLVCPGSPQLATAVGSGDVGYDEDLGTGADVLPTRTQLHVAGSWQSPALVGQVGAETPRPEATVTVEDTPAPVVARYDPYDGRAPDVVGTTVGHADSGDLRGMVAGACLAPSASTWLVGGNTEVGSSVHLVLTNPGQSPVRITVRGWTGLGAMASETVELLEPNTTTVILGETMERAERIAFHVSAEGGQVGAYLHTSSLNGLVPAGVSYVAPTTAPGLDTLIGPVHLEPFDAEEAETVVRILNPGPQNAHVSLTLLGPEGEEDLGGAQNLTIDAGTVSDVPVAATQAGEYSVRISSDEPVTGAVRSAVTGTESEELAGVPVDISWLPGAHPTSAAQLATGEESEIAVTNPSGDVAEVQVESVGSSGALKEAGVLTLAGGSTQVVEVPDDAVALRFTGGPLLVTAQYRLEVPDGALIAAVPGSVQLLTQTSTRVLVGN